MKSVIWQSQEGLMSVGAGTYVLDKHRDAVKKHPSIILPIALSLADFEVE